MSENERFESSESIPWNGEEVEVTTCSDLADSPSQGEIHLNRADYEHCTIQVETAHNAVGSLEDESILKFEGFPAEPMRDKDAPLRDSGSPLEETCTSQETSCTEENLKFECEGTKKDEQGYLCCETKGIGARNQINVQESSQKVEKPSTSKTSSANKTDSNKMNEEGDKEKTPAIQLEYIFHCKTHPTIVFYTESEFKVHQRCELNCRASVKCPICQKPFTTKTHCKHHQLTIHINSPQRIKEPQSTCYFCTATLVRKFNLEHHLRIHTLEKPFKCEMCEGSFSSILALTNHKKSVHRDPTTESPFKCEMCQKSFSCKSALNLHKKSIHRDPTKESPFKCNICQKSCDSISALDYHRNTVHRDPTKKSPFNCEICQKSYGGRSALDYHKNTVHRDATKESPFKCEICQKSFPTKVNLNYHKKSVHRDPTKESPFKCEICQKSFSCKSVLDRHKKNIHKDPEIS